MTNWFVRAGIVYLRQGPHSSRLSDASLTACSSIVVLLACVPLFNAMRSSGPKWLAAILLAPLVTFSLTQAARGAIAAILPVEFRDDYAFYFYAEIFASGLAWIHVQSVGTAFFVEAAKWLACLSIAIWLSIAQLAVFRRRGRASNARIE